MEAIMAGFAPAGGFTMPAVKDMPEGGHDCDGCRGDGVYYGAGYVNNGKFVGFTGTCFRCSGKGWQDDRDIARNRCYDRHRRYA